MISPFPGMDPYLEDSVLWPGVHNSFIYCLRSALNRELPPNYVANIEERLYVSETERRIVPDVAVVRNAVGTTMRSSHGGAALMDRVAAPTILTVWDEEQTETYIQIQEAGGGTVVTIVELLSYANKSTDGAGRGLYLQKQREVLESSVHLLEIDLLRAGRHTVSAPFGPMELKFNRWDYLVCLSRSFNRHQYGIWPLALRKRLPCIMVPLKLENEGVAVDLQAVFNRVYDEGAYDRNVDYQRLPPIPLRREDELWADRLLRKKGLRS
jgi:hypothetical protein